MSDSWGWRQYDLALFPDGDGPPPAPWSDLRRLLDELRTSGRVDHAWMVRKPPGLRLRLAGTELTQRAEVDIVTWLHRAERSDAIRGWRPAVYEPELARFGGPLGLALAHEQFDHDTELALRYETLDEQGRACLPRWAASVAVTADLLRRTTADRAEALDVWVQLADALPGPAVGAVPPPASTLVDALRGDESWLASLPAGAGELLRRSAAGNDRFASRLDAVLAAGSLEVGRRAMLVALTVFHWNRFGLGGRSLGAVLPEVVARLRPPDGTVW